MFNYASLTKNGASLLARATNGEKFVFTRMEYGNGIPESFDASKTDQENKAVLSAMTSLVSKKADIGMYNVSVKNNCATLTGKIISSSLTEDFLAKELGVYGKIGDESDVLVAYFIATENPDPINQAALIGQEHKVIVDVATGNATNFVIEYNPEVYATKEEFDAMVASNAEEHAALEQAIADLSASVDEKIGNIDISSSLAKTFQFDHVVDSDESLFAWASCTDGSMKKVLVKAGTYSLAGKMINLVTAGTKFIFGESGNKINITEYDRGIGATADYGAVVIGLNVSVANETYSDGEIDGVFYRGMTCINCSGTGNSAGNIEGIFNQCSCIDCKATATATGTSADYYSCKGLFEYTFDESTATLTINV